MATSATTISKMLKHDFTVVDNFKYGYRSREDITNLPPGVLVAGSQNVLVNAAKRVQVRQGYTLDGLASTTLAGIDSTIDWEMHTGSERHQRVYLDPATSLGVMQYRYVDSAGTVTWRNLKIDFASSVIRWCDWWDNTQLIGVVLMVDGSSNIYEWNGAIATFASATTVTITKEGTTSWAEEGFYNTTSPRKVVINGVVYTYTGGETTTTLTGVTPDPTGVTITAGDPIHQEVITTANSGITSLPATFANDLISNLKQQIYIGSHKNRSVYVSVVNNYKSVAFTSPVRVVGEGGLLTLDACPVAFIPQEDSMYISAGKGQWYQTTFGISSDNSKETLTVTRLKTSGKQGTKSQELTFKKKNDVIFVSNENVFCSLGRVLNIQGTPQTSDLSYSIVNDFNNYDFTNGAVFNLKNYSYISIPDSNIIIIYNETDPNNIYWEAPQTIAVSRFYTVGGELYAHSALTPESYKLFTGYNDNGGDYKAVVKFSYMNFGTRTKTKGFSEFYSEGYLDNNTTIKLGLRKEIDGCAIDTSYTLKGNNKKFVCIPTSDASLGKVPLGKNPLGGTKNQSTFNVLPPKFRWIRTFPLEPYFYEFQPSYESTGIDQRWELLAFGVNLTISSDLNNNISE
jgi:hypothetical protein